MNAFGTSFADTVESEFQVEAMTSPASLQELLSKEAVVTEARCNPTLRQRLEEKLRQLVGVLTAEEQENTQETRATAFVVCELLKSDDFLDMFARDVSAIHPLCDYLCSTAAQNWTQAAYCSLILRRLCSKHQSLVRTFLREQPAYISGLKRKLNVRPVADLFLSLIADDTECSDESIKGRFTLFKELLLMLDAKRGSEEVMGASYVLREVMGRSAEMHGWGLFACFMLSKESLERFEDAIQSTNPAILASAAAVLGSLLDYSDMSGLLDSLDATMEAINSRSFEELPEVRSISYEEIPDIFSPSPLEDQAISRLTRVVKAAINALQALPQDSQLPTSFNQTIPPIGPHRMALIHLVNTALKLDLDSIQSAVADSLYIRYMLITFQSSPWNSAFHHEFEQLVRVVTDSPSKELQEELFVKAGLVDVLLGEAEGKHSVRRGNLGHVTRIGNAIFRISTVNMHIQQCIQTQNWEVFVANYLIPRNLLESAQVSSPPALQVQALPIADDEEEPEFASEPTEQVSFPLQVSSDPEVEFEQGSDVFNSLHYWSLPLSCEELPDLV